MLYRRAGAGRRSGARVREEPAAAEACWWRWWASAAPRSRRWRRCASGRRGGPSGTRGCFERDGPAGAPRAPRRVEAGDLEALGDAMNVNHGLLAALGLSSPRARRDGAPAARAGRAGREAHRRRRRWRRGDRPVPRARAARSTRLRPRGRALLRAASSPGPRAVSPPMKATALAHPNIALVKYWGKRDEALILPHQSSLSVTLAPLSVTTTVEFGARARTRSSSTATRRKGSERERVLRAARGGARARRARKLGPAQVVSRGDFPTAAGLASSAAGFAALAVAARAAAGLPRGRAGGVACSRGRAAARRAAASRAASASGTAASRADGADSFAEQAFTPSALAGAAAGGGDGQPRGEGGEVARRDAAHGGDLAVLPGVGEGRRGGGAARAARSSRARDLEALGELCRAQRVADARDRVRRGSAALLPEARDARRSSSTLRRAAHEGRAGVVHARRGAQPGAAHGRGARGRGGGARARVRRAGGGALRARRRRAARRARSTSSDGALPSPRPGKLFLSGEYAVLWGGVARGSPRWARGPAALGAHAARTARCTWCLEEGTLRGRTTPLRRALGRARCPRASPSSRARWTRRCARTARESLGFELALSPSARGPGRAEAGHGRQRLRDGARGGGGALRAGGALRRAEAGAASRTRGAGRQGQRRGRGRELRGRRACATAAGNSSASRGRPRCRWGWWRRGRRTWCAWGRRRCRRATPSAARAPPRRG